MKKKMTQLLITGMAVVFSGLCVSAADESLASGIYTLTNVANPEVEVGVTGGYWDDATELLCLYSSDVNYQKFSVQITDTGRYTIQAVHSDKYIQTVDDTDPVLRQYASLLGTGVEAWQFIDMGDGKYQIQSESGLCVGTEGDTPENGTRLVLEEAEPDDQSQLWELEVTEKNEEEVTLQLAEGDYVELEDGVYEISSVLNGTCCWALSQDETSETPLLIQWERVLDDTQKFTVKQVMKAKNTGDALYSISPVQLPDKVLQKNYNNLIEAVDYVEDNGSQLWQFVYGGFGRYLVRCVDGVFAACQNGDISNGNAIALIDYSLAEDTNCMKWFLTKKTD